MVPRLLIMSALVIPIPVSMIVTVLVPRSRKNLMDNSG